MKIEWIQYVINKSRKIYCATLGIPEQYINMFNDNVDEKNKLIKILHPIKHVNFCQRSPLQFLLIICQINDWPT